MWINYFNIRLIKLQNRKPIPRNAKEVFLLLLLGMVGYAFAIKRK